MTKSNEISLTSNTKEDVFLTSLTVPTDVLGLHDSLLSIKSENSYSQI